LWNKALTAADVSKLIPEFRQSHKVVEPVVENIVGWPTYMHDDRRSGYTTEKLAMPLRQSWAFQSSQPPSPAWPPPAKQDFWHNKTKLPARVTFDRAYHPVSDGTHVCFGSSSDDKVYCLDMTTGRKKWEFFTEGPVRLAPTISDGHVFFGSDDGHVYCANISTGKLNWKFAAGPSRRRISGNNRIISAWPVRTDVLVRDKQVRFAAGLFPNEGVFQYVLDANTGKELASGKIALSPQGYLRRDGSRILVPRGRAPAAQLAQLARRTNYLETPSVKASKDAMASIGAGAVTIIATATPDDKDEAVSKITVIDNAKGTPLWSNEVPGVAYGLAVAGERLLVTTDHGTIHCFANVSLPVTPNSPTNVAITATKSAAGTGLKTALDDHPVGYCLVAGIDDGQLVFDLATNTELQIVVAESDAAKVKLLRNKLDAAGLYGRVSVHHGELNSLPYANGLFNVVTTEYGDPTKISELATQFARLVRPSGGLFALGDVDETANQQLIQSWAAHKQFKITNKDRTFVAQRNRLPGAGSWTHMYGNTENQSCSDDELVKTDFQLQWFGRPGPENMIDRHHRTVPPLVLNERMYVPGDNRVIAVDAYNGTILWNREVPNSRRVGAMRDAGSMAANEKGVFIAADSYCLLLNGADGKLAKQYAIPGNESGAKWGFTAVDEKTLYGSMTKPGASRDGHSRKTISQTYYDQIEVVTSDGLFAVDLETGDKKWRYDSKQGAVLNPTIAIGPKNLYFMESHEPSTKTNPKGRSKLTDFFGGGSSLVAIDRETGIEAWRKTVDFKHIQHHLYLSYAKGKIVTVGTFNRKDAAGNNVWYEVVTLDAKKGELIWKAEQNQRQGTGGSHGEQDHHPTIVGDRVVVEPKAYNLADGRVVESWTLQRGGHGCGALSASKSAAFFRAANPTLSDLATGQKKKVTTVSRPGCWINIIPASGMLLIPEASSGCTCNFAIQSSLGFAPKGGWSQPEK
jgi:outer membrane protein assembly factor BamB